MLTDEEKQLLLELAAVGRPLLVTEYGLRLGHSFEGGFGARLKGSYADLGASLGELRRRRYVERTHPGEAWRYKLTSRGKQAAAALTLQAKKPRAGKHGPAPDIATGKRVEAIIEKIPNREWTRKENQQQVRQLLQDNDIDTPKNWKQDGLTWLDQGWELVRAAIRNHLENARRQG